MTAEQADLVEGDLDEDAERWALEVEADEFASLYEEGWDFGTENSDADE
jgi:hypothetical protein